MKMAKSSINSNHWIYSWLKGIFFWAFTPGQWKLSFIGLYTYKVLWQHTNVYMEISSISNKFEVWVSCVQPQHFMTFAIGFSVLFIKMEFNSLPDFLNTGFTIIELVCFVVANTEVKIILCKFLAFTNKMVIFI